MNYAFYSHVVFQVGCPIQLISHSHNNYIRKSRRHNQYHGKYFRFDPRLCRMHPIQHLHTSCARCYKSARLVRRVVWRCGTNSWYNSSYFETARCEYVNPGTWRVRAYTFRNMPDRQAGRNCQDVRTMYAIRHPPERRRIERRDM